MTVKNEMMSKIVIWFIFITSFVIFLNLQTLEAINFPEKEVKTWNANKFQSSINSFIVNGLVSQPTLFYAKIRFGRGSTEFCGATIVDEIFVMTSAFCVYSYHRELSPFGILTSRFFNIRVEINIKYKNYTSWAWLECHVLIGTMA